MGQYGSAQQPGYHRMASGRASQKRAAFGHGDPPRGRGRVIAQEVWAAHGEDGNPRLGWSTTA